MDNKEFNIILSNLGEIIDCLDHIMENEKKKLSHVINSNSILGKCRMAGVKMEGVIQL